MLEIFRMAAIAQHSKQIHNISIQIVVDLGIASGLADQNRTGAAENFCVNPMARKVGDDPIGKQPFAAVPSQHRAFDLNQIVCLPVDHHSLQKDCFVKNHAAISVEPVAATTMSTAACE